jgi:hypothetical protein
VSKPATYSILSDNFVLGSKGDTVSDDELGGCDVDALITGGHLAPAKSAQQSPTAVEATNTNKEQ